MRQRIGGPTLPKQLRDQIGDPANYRKDDGHRGDGPLNRKERRQAERTVRRNQKPVKGRNNFRRARDESDNEAFSSEDEAPPPPLTPRSADKGAQKPLKSILKQRRVDPEPDAYDNAQSTVSRAVKDRLVSDDAEIRALEKKLGIKGKKSKPSEDGLDDIFGDLGVQFGSDEEENSRVGNAPPKRKRNNKDEEWLASKRRKALGHQEQQQTSEVSDEEDFDSLEDENDDIEDLADPESDDQSGTNGIDVNEEDSEDFESGDDFSEVSPEPSKPRVRENPYVAPVTTDTPQPAKYIPPALRTAPASDVEALARLRRQIQGLFNRLSDANMLTILRDIELIYQNNARGYVNNTLTDLLIGLITDETTLLDTFLVLHAGFIAAVYKVIGTDFGAQMVERLVVEFEKHYQPNKEGRGKQTTNIITIIAQLYCFQVIGSNLVFDYLKRFLDELSEINTELILRFVRTSGSQLRQDDPTSLKDIVMLLQKSVAQVGEKNLLVRTKFMIETINNLKNNRMKTGVAASAIVNEHTVRMKKQIGTLNTRSLKGTEPLRISLADIKDTEKKGKWWLVGASWRTDTADQSSQKPNKDNIRPDGQDTAEDGEVDLLQLAKEQRMNTDVRRAIFVTVMSATDSKDAYIRLTKLGLKKSQEAEIPRVIIHCAGCEKQYNPYYTLLARKFCMDHKSRKSLQFTLWDVFKGLGDRKGDNDEEEISDEEEGTGDDEATLRKLVNLGKLFGTLIAREGLPITSLKLLNFAYLKAKETALPEVILVTTILQSQKGAKVRNEKGLLEIFVGADQSPDMIPGLQYFLKKVVAKTGLTTIETERETIQWAVKSVLSMLTRLLAMTSLEDT